MKRRWLFNLGLLAVVGLLAWLAWKQPGKAVVKPSPITHLTEARINHIEIRPRGEPAVVLEKRKGTWFMRSPFHGRADTTRVGFVLDFLHAKTSARFPVVAKDLPTYELDKPRVSLTLNNQRFDFGGDNAMTMDRYVRHGDHVYLVFDTSYPYLTGNPASFVDPQLIESGKPIVGIHVPGLEVTQTNGKLAANGAGAGVSADVLARFVENWRAARADSVQPLHSENAGGGADITIRFDGAPPLKLQILKRRPELVLAVPNRDLAYHFPAEDAKALLSLTKAKSVKK